jgi:hypothetical protein
MELHTIGIDLGKTVFHLVGLNLHGEVLAHKKPGVIHSNKGRIHLRRPTRDITFRLRQSGGPYIPVCRPLGIWKRL